MKFACALIMGFAQNFIIAAIRRIFLVVSLAVATVFSADAARAEVTISPLRAVLDDRASVARFQISNPTPRIIEGSASWIDLAAEKAGYRHLAGPARSAISAAPLLTLYPARFRLEPGARTEIVVRLRAGATPRPGELRTHLFITTQAPRGLLRRAQAGGLQVDVATGLSVPILLRGDGDAKARIGATKLYRDEAGALSLETQIARQGSHSTFGELIATFAPAGGAAEITLAQRANVAAHVDAPERVFELPLSRHELPSGILTLVYQGNEEYAGRVFSIRTFNIAPPE